jgi:glycosyltransferase involved in cell wall biosynthesis
MSEIATNGAVVITFILPVLNRKEVIIRAVASCLTCQSERIEPRVLIVDGGSRDGTRELIETVYSADSRVVLLSQPEDQPGFMNACYFGVSHLDSPLATFMYSDDILSPHFFKLAEALLDEPCATIALGYGRQANENELIDFPVVTAIEKVESERVLYAYYGRAEYLDGKALPVSPVCCAVRSSVLKAWVGYVQEFTSNNPLRHYSMIRLAGGPDLMIYLSALLYGEGKVIRANHTIGQLTITAVSITSSGNREAQLTVGYWQARLWGFITAIEMGKFKLAGQFAGYLLAVFFFVMSKKIIRREISWTSKLNSELWGLLKIAAKQGLLISMLQNCVASLWSRFFIVLGIERKKA